MSATANDPQADPFDARVVAGASGLLREFNAIGLLSPADVHVAHRIAAARSRRTTRRYASRSRSRCAPRGSATCSSTWRRSRTPPPSSPRSRSTSRRCRGRRRAPGRKRCRPAAWSRSAKTTSTATDRCACSAPACTSTATGARSAASLPTCRSWRGPAPPARSRRELARRQPRATVRRRVRRSPAARCEAVLTHRFAVIAGGPGTGKTTTVARIVALLAEQAAAQGLRQPLVALAAPTGKAAARLQEAVHEEAARLRVEEHDQSAAARSARLDAASAARLAAGLPQPLRARSREPPAPRRRDRR